MKQVKSILAALVIMAGAGSAVAQNQVFYEGVGPVVAGSVSTANLPKNANKYINRYFSDQNVIEVEKEFLDNEYDVKLSSGIELTFNKRGHIIEIDAPDNLALNEKTVRSLLPGNAYEYLYKNKYSSNIETVKKTRQGYEVDLNDSVDTEIFFAKDGSLVAIEYD